MKKILIRIKDWFIKVKPSKRKIIQLYTALLYNANLKGFIKGRIFTGKSKVMCVPGLNCYSCPGAIGSCPLGSIQGAISNSNKSLPFYVFGIILLYCVIFGRTICGWLCPVGFTQELAYMIKTPKVKKNQYTRLLSYFKYVLLVIFVILIPLAYSKVNLPVPGFCKYICPAGIFEGAFFLLGHPSNTNFLGMLGPIFTWKFFVFVLLFVGCIFVYRLFCRFICPLGAIYGLFNKFSLLGVKVNNETCIKCGKCVKECKMDIKVVGDHECINCGECISVCPTNAIEWKGNKFKLPPNEIVKVNNKDDYVNPEVEKDNKENKKVLKLITQIGATVLLIGALIYGYFGDKKDEPSNNNSTLVTGDVAKVGDLCTTFEITSVNGKELFNNEAAKGKVTFLNFWFVDCVACVEEIPHFETFYKEYKNDVNMVCINPVDDLDYMNMGVTELGWDNYELNVGYPTGSVNLEKYFEIKEAYPFTAILDRNGVIKYLISGSIEYDKLISYYNAVK